MKPLERATADEAVIAGAETIVVGAGVKVKLPAVDTACVEVEGITGLEVTMGALEVPPRLRLLRALPTVLRWCLRALVRSVC